MIKFADPDISWQECKAVRKTLKSGWITTGEKSQTFEEEVGKFIGSKYNIAVSSCTAAVHLCLKVLGVEEGDEIITSPMTFVSTINVIEHCGAKPVFVDIEKNTLNICTNGIIDSITSKTKAIIVTHYAGQPCDMDKINDISKKYNIPVIEDAAHAFGAKYDGKYIGNTNNLVCFSFYATKNITTGEGGMICTNDSKYVEKLKTLRLHGMSKDAWKRYSLKGTPKYDVECPGFKYNLMDISAAMGIEQLKKINKFSNKRKNLVNEYLTEIRKNQLLCECLTIKDNRESSNYLFTVLLDKKFDRDYVIEKLKEKKICTSILFVPVNKFTYYKMQYRDIETILSNVEEVENRILCLPLHTKMRKKDVRYVVRKLKEVMSECCYQ